MELLIGLFMWPIATVLFGWATYRLLVRKVSMAMIYTLAVFHALNVLALGAAPYLVTIWAILSGLAIIEFKKFLKPIPN